MGQLIVTVAAGLFIAAVWVDRLASTSGRLALTGLIVLVALALYSIYDE
jgi:hypothetical protein